MNESQEGSGVSAGSKTAAIVLFKSHSVLLNHIVTSIYFLININVGPLESYYNLDLLFN